jgi:CheY-like chemotaxis protein
MIIPRKMKRESHNIKIMNEPRKTLIIDFDAASAGVTRDVLTLLGINETIIISDFETAKMFLEKHRVLLITIELETAGSLNFIKWLRRNTTNANFQAPIIALSAKPTKELVSDARDAGATEFVLKPIDKAILKDILIGCMTRPRNFIIARGYAGPERRRKVKPLTVVERRVTPEKKDD